MNTKNKHIILFDGDCNFCNFWVNFVIENDKNDSFRFASLQSKKGKELIEQTQLKSDLDSVVLISNNIARTKSSAALHIAKHLKGWFQIAFVLIVVPKFIRDIFYDLIAKNRKKFLKNESCIIPSDQIKKKFI